MDDATRKLVDNVMAYAQHEGLTERGIAMAAIRMTLKAAQRPPVTPEQREAMIRAVITAGIDWEGRNTGTWDRGASVVDALLARFSLPVLDVEKVAVLRAALDNARRHDAFTIRQGGCPHPDYTRLLTAADALIATLPTLTREGANE